MTWRRSTSAAITSTFQVSKRCGCYPCPVVDTAGSTVVPKPVGVLFAAAETVRVVGLDRALSARLADPAPP